MKYKQTVAQRVTLTVGSITGFVGAYFGMVMLLQLDKTLTPADPWIISMILTPCLLAVLGGASLLSYHGTRKWWKWVTDK